MTVAARSTRNGGKIRRTEGRNDRKKRAIEDSRRNYGHFVGGCFCQLADCSMPSAAEFCNSNRGGSVVSTIDRSNSQARGRLCVRTFTRIRMLRQRNTGVLFKAGWVVFAPSNTSRGCVAALMARYNNYTSLLIILEIPCNDRRGFLPLI